MTIFTRMVRRQLVTGAALLAILAGGAAWAAGVPDRPWPDSQDGLGLDADGFDSWAAAPAVLPGKLVVIPPPKRLPAALKEYAGRWSGWMCTHRSTDLKVVFTRVAATAATATVAWSETESARGIATWPLKRAGDEFRYDGPDVLYKFHLRPVDDVRAGLPVMDVMRILADGTSCNGILRRESAR